MGAIKALHYNQNMRDGAPAGWNTTQAPCIRPDNPNRYRVHEKIFVDMLSAAERKKPHSRR